VADAEGRQRVSDSAGGGGDAPGVQDGRSLDGTKRTAAEAAADGSSGGCKGNLRSDGGA
jgi:hypothetical protein